MVASLSPTVETVAELVLEVRVLVEHHQRALALEVPHEARHRQLGRYAHQHMHVVGHQVPLDDLDPLVPAQLPEYLTQRVSVLVVYSLSPILRCGHDMVLAHPLRVRQAVSLICHDGRLSGRYDLNNRILPDGKAAIVAQGRSHRCAPA